MTTEPRVEDLLATIRKAIDRDINELDAREGLAVESPSLRGTLEAEAPQVRGRDADSSIASLRQRVQRHALDESELWVDEAADTAAAPRYEPLEPHAGPLEPDYEPLMQQPPPAPAYPQAAPEAYYAPPHHMPPHVQPHMAHAPQQGGWIEAQPAPEAYFHDAPPPPVMDQSLISPQSAYAAQASFQALANAMLAQVGGDAGLQNTAREMLRPMLKRWLDDNLPPLVEKLVREEIERVARRPR